MIMTLKWQVDNVSVGVSESSSLFAAKAALSAVRTQNALSDAEVVGSASSGDYLHVQYEGTYIHTYIINPPTPNRSSTYKVYIHTYYSCACMHTYILHT